MKRIYIAGPMTGFPNLNFPAFHSAAGELRAAGHLVENPAEINADPAASRADCLRADFARLVLCDAIYLLPGWQESAGASLEMQIAQSLELEVFNPWILRCSVRQARALACIRQFIREHGTPPPMKTVAFHIGTSGRNVWAHIKRLESCGLVAPAGRGKYIPTAEVN